VNGEHKITSGHRARAALVYLRQSTLVQVREHTESTMRQYALADVAVSLGWAPRDVEVIDRDLGLSGTSAAHRQGFRDLMSRVCLGEAGAVLGLEVSRLARSNADLARLAEMARLTGTLLIDSDGVYDLSDFNDWLVLGLKSTMSQAELHIMAGRLQAAKLAAAERGELRVPLPAGLVYDDDGMVVTDPDAEVRAAVADVFACFAAAGSAYGVVAAFAGRKVMASRSPPALRDREIVSVARYQRLSSASSPVPSPTPVRTRARPSWCFARVRIQHGGLILRIGPPFGRPALPATRMTDV
jgi:DNA invertase Pin-like site-specific DNA recombinase